MWGNILGSPQAVSHLGQASSERESREFQINATGGYSDSVTGIVERVPKVLGHVCRDIGDSSWQYPSKLDLVNPMVGLIRVRLNNALVWARTLESLDIPASDQRSVP